MKTGVLYISRIAYAITAVCLAVGALGISTGVQGREGAPAVPAAISVPGGFEVERRFSATGVQIYRCQSSAQDPTSFVWTFIAPEATLFDREGKVAGHHYAGPTWEANDGSKIVGKVISKVAAPDGVSIPWLLLGATVVQAGETFEHIAFVQRLNTNGGSAPANGCASSAANVEVRVPYSAEYYFYGPQ